MIVYAVIEENGDDATWASHNLVALYQKKEDATKAGAKLAKKQKGESVFRVKEWEVL
jgi:hypothetical protein